jgi:hypothetical protein
MQGSILLRACMSNDVRADPSGCVKLPRDGIGVFHNDIIGNAFWERNGMLL